MTPSRTLRQLAAVDLEKYERFGIDLCLAMKRHRISQRMLALESGIDHSTISRIVSGSRQTPGVDTAVALSAAIVRICDRNKEEHHAR